MNRLRSVVKMTRLRLQDRRRELADIETMERDLMLRISGIDRDIEEEGRHAAASLEMTQTYSRFLSLSLMRRRKLESSLANLASEKEVAEELVREAFQELKKFETVLDRRVEEERTARLRREQRDLDEMARNLKRVAAARGI